MAFFEALVSGGGVSACALAPPWMRSHLLPIQDEMTEDDDIVGGVYDGEGDEEQACP